MTVMTAGMGILTIFLKVIRHVFRSSYSLSILSKMCAFKTVDIKWGCSQYIYLCFNTKKIRNMFITHFNKWLHKKG